MIIFINGSINSGKTAVAKMLTQRIPNTANVEIDSLRDFIDWLEIDQAVPINLENAVFVINNFAKHGYNVVVPYPLSHKNYAYMKNQLKDYANELYIFTLAPDIKKARASTPDRKLTQREHDRIKHQYDIGISTPSFGKIINNTNQTPEQTVDEILSYLPKNY